MDWARLLGAGRSARGARAAAARARGAQAGARAGVGAAGRGREQEAARQGARAAGRQERAGQGRRRGRAGRWAWARGVRGLGVAWAPGLALGSALSALGPFSIRFDSFFSLSHQMNTVHCKVKFFRKKNIIY